MPSHEQMTAGTQQRLISLREQQLSYRLGVTLWRRVGEDPVFQTSDSANVDPSQEKVVNLANDSDALTFVSDSEQQTKSKLSSNPPTAGANNPERKQPVLRSDTTSNHQHKLNATDSQPLSLKVSGASVPVETTLPKQTSLNQPNQAMMGLADHPKPRSKSTFDAELKPVKTPTSAEELAEPGLGGETQLPAQPMVASVDPNDAFAEAVLADAEVFDDYLAARNGSQAVQQLLDQLGNSARSARSEELNPSTPSDHALSPELKKSAKSSVNQRVEWLSFVYGDHLVVIDASALSSEAQQLLSNIAGACRVSLQSINFPLDQSDQLPAYFSDQQAFTAFIKGRLARSGARRLLCLGQINAPWNLVFTCHEAPSLQACLDNPLLKADLWRQLHTDKF